jgi:hypothetical protein
MSEVKTTPGIPLPTSREPSDPDAPDPGVPATLSALIDEAESLHQELAAIRVRTGRLVAALRRYRKRERLVASTLASLKELRLPEAAG